MDLRFPKPTGISRLELTVINVSGIFDNEDIGESAILSDNEDIGESAILSDDEEFTCDAGRLELTVINVSGIFDNEDIGESAILSDNEKFTCDADISVLCNFSFIGDGSSFNSKWKKMEQIGCGSSCKVYKAVYPYSDSGFEYEIAVKEVQINLSKKAKEKLEKSVNTEINILKKLRHKNIVQYFGHFQDEFNYFIFMELLNAGPLSHYIDDNREKPKGLKRSLVVKFTRQILDGLKCIHKARIIHRDIKAENILVTNMENIKIADFGISKVFEKFSKASTRGVGTLRYMAPERFGSDSYSYPVDIWAVGCVVFEMITGSLPFKKFEDHQIFKVMSEACPFPFLHCDNAMLLSTKDEAFLAYIFKKNPEERPTVDELIINSYLAGKSNSKPLNVAQVLFQCQAELLSLTEKAVR